jgi:hypothetical protein
VGPTALVKIVSNIAASRNALLDMHLQRRADANP